MIISQQPNLGPHSTSGGNVTSTFLRSPKPVVVMQHQSYAGPLNQCCKFMAEMSRCRMRFYLPAVFAMSFPSYDQHIYNHVVCASSCSTADVIINEDGSCGGGWVCEHRWAPIAGMAGFAKAANGQPYINRHRGSNEMAWSRGDR